MKPLEITSQKTAVLGENQSRNSIRPVLEQAGFQMNYEPFSRTLSVMDGVNQPIANIVGVKGIQDIERRSRIVPLTWVGSDLGEEIFDSRDMVRKVLETDIGTCSLQYINVTGEPFSLNGVEKIYTKSPRYLKQVLREYYQDDFNTGDGAPENSPEDLRVWELLSSFRQKVEYSDSPDTTVADISKKSSRTVAGWEIVQTGESVKQLGLQCIPDQGLTRKVSTDMYANINFVDQNDETFRYFLDKIKKALGEI